MKKIKGFTLIELMVVVIIIGILAVAIAPRIPDLVRKAREGATKGNLGTLRSTLNIYYSNNEGVYPTTSNSNELTAALVPKYIKSIPYSYIPVHHEGEGQGKNNFVCISSAPTDSNVEDNGPNNRNNGWAYCYQSTHPDWGGVWIACSHTDLSGQKKYYQY